jgi:hypothetical protein
MKSAKEPEEKQSFEIKNSNTYTPLDSMGEPEHCFAMFGVYKK